MNARKSERKSARERFADNMRMARLRMRLSQEELAERAGLHRTYIGSVERGSRNISIDNMEAIAIALDLELAELLQE
jgi:transcriptional regulator with XRE-family HTH domain